MARKSSRKLWAEHLAKGAAKPGKAQAPVSLRLGNPFRGLILGIDPSLRAPGFAVVDVRGQDDLRVLSTKTLRLKASYAMAECLGAIAKEVTVFLDEFPVLHVALEQTIYVQNFQTAQILGAARGAAIAPGAMRGIPVFEYPPLRVKQAVAGYGRASKEQVLGAIRGLTGIDLEKRYDEADAVAVAICHAFTWREAVSVDA